jgi:uncharacterized membrane protein
MSTPKPKIRLDFLDLVRGNAIVLMFVYHFCFGLAQIGVLNAQFSSDYFWIGFRTLIIFLFLSLVGMGLYLSKNRETFTIRFAKRMLLLALYAGLITGISYLVRPNYYVYFGILHHIFIASLLGLLFAHFYQLNLLLGIGAIIVGIFIESSLFNTSSLHWLGLGTQQVRSDDFAPLFPWFGFVLLGLFFSNLIFQQQKLPALRRRFVENWKPRSIIGKTLCWAGRQSLHLYFIHFISFYFLVYLLS